jgi:hypothetical protein
VSGLGAPLRLGVGDPDLAATLAVLTADLAIWAPAAESIKVRPPRAPLGRGTPAAVPTSTRALAVVGRAAGSHRSARC